MKGTHTEGYRIKTYGTYLTIYTKWLYLNGITYEIKEPTFQHINMDKVWIYIPRQNTKEKRRWLAWWFQYVFPQLMQNNNEMIKYQYENKTELLFEVENDICRI